MLHTYEGLILGSGISDIGVRRGCRSPGRTLREPGITDTPAELLYLSELTIDNIRAFEMREYSAELTEIVRELFRPEFK